ncbi:hypothetical protein NP7_12255 (plasmid) [Moraxella osloensis]|uniref:Uncharacterized protein n=1 Tax=Faucicola osloensis TaxID=34062 RepID=A0A2D2LYN0_FAUOS|nr:hypothetical protein NP7_12255 [Moraxella osloensis]
MLFFFRLLLWAVIRAIIMRLKQVILALFIVRFCVNISLSLLRFGIMVVREKNCYYAIALTDFFVFLSCAEKEFI